MMKNRRFLLTLISLLLIAAFFALPPNYQWAGKVLGYLNEIPQQSKQPSLETRRKKRLGTSYTYSRQIAAELENRGIASQVLVLMPATTYFAKRGITYHVPEPAVFYYYTGLKTIWPNSPHAANAGWMVSVRNGKIVVDSVVSKEQIRDSILVFKKWGVNL
ncbi:hypothetical protein [Paraflavitalea sp. CAU 1676]|uniref:hypothetical protein n=1 Tax=Paraflavitalea sp. CAU 1676 TaxID=3032598 RepID=UPI0023DC3070|nr:hypothetical protein [Paraflavitalea sp. CAU 1676]MDF2190154.1 hypothetical protein [Paraflavitalea sp. CAU 1676]